MEFHTIFICVVFIIIGKNGLNRLEKILSRGVIYSYIDDSKAGDNNE